MVRGRPIQKGQVLNPGGKPKTDPLVQKFKETTYKDFIDNLQELGSMPREDIKKIVADPKTPVFRLIFARVLKDAMDGRVESQKMLFERLWGKVKETDLDPKVIDVNPRPLKDATPEQIQMILKEVGK